MFIAFKTPGAKSGGFGWWMASMLTRNKTTNRTKTPPYNPIKIFPHMGHTVLRRHKDEPSGLSLIQLSNSSSR